MTSSHVTVLQRLNIVQRLFSLVVVDTVYICIYQMVSWSSTDLVPQSA